MQIQHHAFLDLENALTYRLDAAWTRLWGQYVRALSPLLVRHQFDQARAKIADFQLDALATKHKKLVESIGAASLLLGASRLKAPRLTHVAQHLPTNRLESSGKQFQVMVSNAADAMRVKILQWIDQLEQKQKDTFYKFEADIEDGRFKIEVAGRKYLGLASSLQISRMSAFGFLAEAVENNLQFYRIDATLDDRTCEVCRWMDGRVFPVESGFAHANTIMDAEDPETLKQVAPWWVQNPESLKELKTYNTDDLIEVGMSLPPYHPFCRCIIVKTEESAAQHFGDMPDREGWTARTLWGDEYETPAFTPEDPIRVPMHEEIGPEKPVVPGIDQVNDAPDLLEQLEHLQDLQDLYGFLHGALQREISQVRQLRDEGVTDLQELLRRVASQEISPPQDSFGRRMLLGALRRLPQWPWVVALIATLTRIEGDQPPATVADPDFPALTAEDEAEIEAELEELDALEEDEDEEDEDEQ